MSDACPRKVVVERLLDALQDIEGLVRQHSETLYPPGFKFEVIQRIRAAVHESHSAERLSGD